MIVNLCFDNRAVSEENAGKFLLAFTRALEDPEKILLGADPNLDSDRFLSLL